MPISIAIIGGGIGGLAAAASLLRAGFDVQIFEQAQTLKEVGAGIQISPNASRILHRLGCGDRLKAAGVRSAAWHMRRWVDGRTLLQSPLEPMIEQRFGWPYYQMHRADLLDALKAVLPPDRLHLDRRLVRFADGGKSVVAQFADGTHFEADLMIGADGIHSTVRRQMFGPQNPRFAGCVCYRGLVPVERLASIEIPLETQIWLGPQKHFVHYFVRRGELLNFVAVIEREQWTKESWSDRGNVQEAVAAHEGWHPQVRAILERVDEIFIWGLFDRLPMERWSIGRVTLLGDACHPMLPFMAQGAAQAIEDGAALAACLARAQPDQIVRALADYEEQRLSRTARVQGLSLANKTRFHLPDGPEQAARDAQMAQRATDFSLENVAWIYEHDAGDLTS